MSETTVLQNFMREFFPFNEFRDAGIFDSELKGDYKGQAKRICELFGYDTVFEYGAKEVACHISYSGSAPNLFVTPQGELIERPFITIVENIY